jgi:hypothetical protein
MNPAYRAELEEMERNLRLTNPSSADSLRRYLDHIDLPAAQRRAIDEAHELRQDQLRHLVVFCEDPDFVTLTATYMLSNTSADEIGVRCCDGPRMHCAEISRDDNGYVQIEAFLDGKWPYQRPVIGNA